MSSSKTVRIGIDVGGTFTDAVVVDNDTYQVIAKEKVPTTHHSEIGVAQGIVEVIEKVIAKNNIGAQAVIFIAHGTTQATNALLEGDVSTVGIVGMGSGLEGERAKKETKVGDIELAPGKFLHTEHQYIDVNKAGEVGIDKAIEILKAKGVEVIVASESYSVDDPTNEIKVIAQANRLGMLATGGHEISGLYGLKARSRTASVNAALIPKMMETADMTETAVKNSGISKPLMIMRCDGGVMSVEEVRKRPILTMLSGLAAGVAGALMYEKVTDGIFLEAGGTSTDISVIKNGKVMIRNAQVGGHKIYLTSLDVRTLGIAGGSMVMVENGQLVDVGPRSAHIANKAYEVFTDPSSLLNPQLRLIAPCADDQAKYAVVECENQQQYALTLAGAANLIGYVPQGDYAQGNLESARLAWQTLAKACNSTVEEICTKAMNLAMAKVEAIVKSLISDYELNPNLIYLVGGGGSASVVVPALGEKIGIRHRIAKNAPYISTIGVSLALVREQIERSVINPTETDIRKIRHDITEVITRAGADLATVEIAIEIDAQRNILRAIATGATEIRTKDRSASKKTAAQLRQVVAESVKSDQANVEIVQIAQVGKWFIFECAISKKRFLNLLTTKQSGLRVVDEEGVIRLQKNKAQFVCFTKQELETEFQSIVEAMTTYTDAGATIPGCYLFFGHKMVDMSGVINREQIMSIAHMELEFVDEQQKILAVVAKD